jgi:hypothetical membrane protein
MNKDFRTAGMLILVGITQFLLLMKIAEFIYPNYSVSSNYISDLGVGSTAYIFNTSIIILGLLGMTAAYLLLRWDKTFSILLFISSLGALGVGVFPENMGILHTIPSLITFLFSGIAAIYSYKVDKTTAKYIWPILGIISLISLVLFASKSYMGLGPGGMERMIVYPVFIWLIGISMTIIHTAPEKTP